MTCECGELIHKSSLEAHRQEKHTPIPCKHCGTPLLQAALLLHDCPSAPKKCQFCEAEFPVSQFSEHLYRCSSRTEQCPRCQKYIQIRDYDHHVEKVDCLGVKNSMEERIDRIRNEIIENFEGDPADLEAEVLRRLTEDEDREYAEEVYKKLLMERSPSSDSQIDSPTKDLQHNRREVRREITEKFNDENQERPEEPNDDERMMHEAIMKSLNDAPQLERGISQNSFGVSEEDQLMNEAILKSLQDR